MLLTANQPQPVWLDTDLGADDVLTLVALSAMQEQGLIDLVGVSLVGGNKSLDDSEVLAQQVLCLLGLDNVPIYRGKENENPFFERTEKIHGEVGLCGIDFSSISAKPRAVEPLSKDVIKTITLDGLKPLAVIAIGPLTNIAQFFDPEDVLGLFIMGGAFGQGTLSQGNVLPNAEFNFAIDAPSAAHVLNPKTGYNNIFLAPLDVTHDTLATPAFRARFRDALGPRFQKIADMLDNNARDYPEFPEKSPIHDPHTAWMLKKFIKTLPLACDSQKGFVNISHEGQSSLRSNIAEGNVTVAMHMREASQNRYLGFLISCAKRLGQISNPKIEGVIVPRLTS